MGELDVDGLMETVKEKCQARMLKVDASSEYSRGTVLSISL